MVRSIPLVVMALSIAPVFSQLTYPGCSPLQSSDFQMTELFNRKGTNTATIDEEMSEPTRMDVQVVKNNGVYSHTNVYFVERLGNVKFYDGLTKTVSLMGTIKIWGKADNALMGIVLHPDFEKNRWLYLWYSPLQLVGQNRQLRLTRVTVKSDNTLDMISEKILINIIASKTDMWHSGGPMTFDAYGDLWGAIGNNSNDLKIDSPGDPFLLSVLSLTDSSHSAEWGPSNTANLRGGFFRIHPDSSAKGYSVPRGNFGEYWADQFEKLGRADLAAQYRNPAKVLPEIYVKGERSNFSVAVHPTKRWLAWGSVNFDNINDEFNIVGNPAFVGYPYFHGKNVKTGPHAVDTLAPMNNSPLNSGVTQLPPAVPGALNNLVNVAIGGPIYQFDQSLNSPVKFPPHFHNKWLVAGFTRGLWAITLDSVSLKPLHTAKIDTGIFKTFVIRNHVQSMYGKDGALYILNYDGYYETTINPGVMRVTYNGACKLPITSNQVRKPQSYQNIHLSQAGIMIGEKGRHRFSMYTMSGQRVFMVEGEKGAQYQFARMNGATKMQPGVYMVRVETGAGIYAKQVSVL